MNHFWNGMEILIMWKMFKVANIETRGVIKWGRRYLMRVNNNCKEYIFNGNRRGENKGERRERIVRIGVERELVSP